MKHPFSFLFFPSLLLILFSKYAIAEESYSQHYPVQITTTSIGDGFWTGSFVKEDFLVGLQFTNHSTSFNKEKPNFTNSVSQITQVITTFIQWNPINESEFFITHGVSYRKQIEITEYRGARYEGKTRLDTGRFGSVDVIWPNWGLNLGFGWLWRSEIGLTGGIGYGILLSEPPKMIIDSTAEWPPIPKNQEKYFQAQQEQTRDKLNQLAIWPLYSASIGWTF